MRSRRWLVEAVEDVAPPASPRVSLACADDDAQGQTLEVYWDFEIDRRILEQEAWSSIGARGFDSPRHFSAFLHTLRWNCVTATDPNLFQSPFRAGIRIDAYRMEPLRKALRLPRVNLFIADDTGLGKTIEAGLIARELLLRKKAKTIVVAAPASVLEQWKAEMEERFGLLFVILDRAYLTRVRQERGFGVNPWRTHSRFLVSHNLLIDPTYADPMREWLGEMQPGSLLILDEAHHAAPSSGGRYGIETKFTRAIRDLGGRFEHRLFLSATPHNGHSNSFSTLLELLDPYRFTRGVPVRGRNALEDVMVRRIKEDIRETQGGFPERVVRRIPIEDLPEDAPELLLSRLLDEYRDLREERLKKARARARAAAGLLVVGLQQKLLSSIEAFAISLARHRTSARSFASPPDADDERAGVSDDDREEEEATQIAAINAAAEGEAIGVEVTAAPGLQPCFDVRIQCPGAGDETRDERAVCQVAMGGVDRIGAAGAPRRKRRNVGDTAINDSDDRRTLRGRRGQLSGLGRPGPVQRGDFERRRQADAPYQGLGRHLFKEALVTLDRNILRDRTERRARQISVCRRRVAEGKRDERPIDVAGQLNGHCEMASPRAPASGREQRQGHDAPQADEAPAKALDHRVDGSAVDGRVGSEQLHEVCAERIGAAEPFGSFAGGKGNAVGR